MGCWGKGARLLANVVSQQDILVPYVEHSVADHRMRPGFCLGAIGLVELADLAIFLGVELDERESPVFGPQNDFAVDHQDGAFAGAALLPCFLARL